MVKLKKAVVPRPAPSKRAVETVADSSRVAAFGSPTRSASESQQTPVILGLLLVAMLFLASAAFIPASEFAASRTLRIVAARRVYLAAAGGSILLSALVIVMLQHSN